MSQFLKYHYKISFIFDFDFHIKSFSNICFQDFETPLQMSKVVIGKSKMIISDISSGRSETKSIVDSRFSFKDILQFLKWLLLQ